MTIDDYSYGRVRIGDRVYEDDMVVYPDKVEPHWFHREEERVTPLDIRDVLDYRPDMLIIGQGDSPVMELTPDTKQRLDELGIPWVARATGEAVLLFNEYQPLYKKVVGILHVGA
jgi:hypothetical protein